MSLLQFLRILIARRVILFAALGSCLLVAVIMSQVLPKRYVATARVMMDLVKPDPVTGEVLPTKALSTYTRTQFQLIEDYQIAGPVVDQLGWAQDLTTIDAYSRANSGQDFRRWLAQRIIDGTNVQMLQNSNIMEISYTTSDPQLARQIVDLIRTSYVNDALQTRRDSAKRSAEWFSDQTNKALAALSQAEAARTGFAKANGIVLSGSGVSDIEAEKLSALSSQATTAQVMSGAGGGGMMLAPSAGALSALDQQIQQATQTFGPNHPNLQALKRQRIALASSVAQETAAMASSRSGGINVAQVESAYRQQRSRVLADRDKMDELQRMQRDIDVKRDQYIKSAQRLSDLRVQADVGEVGLSAMGAASASKTPVFPNTPLMIGGSIGIGLALGLILSLLVEMIGRRIRSDDDLESASGAPVLAIIGEHKSGAIAGLVKRVANRIHPATPKLLES